MKKIMLGSRAGTNAAQTLHVTDDGRLGMSEGDWLYETFKRRARFQTRKNGFCEEDGRQMEALALADLLCVRYGYDDTKAKRGNGREAYLNTIVGNALAKAAKAVADERSVWRSRLSLDAAVGDDGDATFVEGVMDGATLSANAKLWGEPRCRVVARMLAEAKRDERAKRRLLERLKNEATLAEEMEEEEMPTNEGASSVTADHDRAIAEMGLADDADEVVEMSGGRMPQAGFGDCAASVYENTLRLDVALVLNDLEPRLRNWCQKVLDGHSPTEAYRLMRYSKSNFYAFALPKLRKAFAALRYAL